jgi:hypothetical protein
MSFFTSVLDVRRLARALDRKPNRETGGVKPNGLSALSEYIYEKVFIPMVMTDAIPVGEIDFDRIREDDIGALYDAFAHSNLDVLGFCLQIAGFGTAASERKIMI